MYSMNMIQYVLRKKDWKGEEEKIHTIHIHFTHIQLRNAPKEIPKRRPYLYTLTKNKKENLTGQFDLYYLHWWL